MQARVRLLNQEESSVVVLQDLPSYTVSSVSSTKTVVCKIIDEACAEYN